MAHAESVKGRWFSSPGQPGDRSLREQMMGLDRLFREVEGKTVLDVGCAEGLLSIELLKSGAERVTGVEIRRDAILEAAHLFASDVIASTKTAHFVVDDANDYQPKADYDIVLMLAVLHKLKDPSTVCARMAAAAMDLVVIRLPPVHAPVINDFRSGHVLHDIGAVMVASGFRLERCGCDGPFNEWVGYYRRNRA